jgi:hypothetical protein
MDASLDPERLRHPIVFRELNFWPIADFRQMRGGQNRHAAFFFYGSAIEVGAAADSSTWFSRARILACRQPGPPRCGFSRQASR